MQIGKMNNASSFRGLWANTDKKVGVDEFRQNIFKRQAVYRPFKDESEEDIQKALNNADGTWSCIDERDDDTIGYDSITIKSELGQRLNITSDEYQEIKQLSDSAEQPQAHYIFKEKIK